MTISSVNTLVQPLGEMPPDAIVFGRTEAMLSVRDRLTKLASANVPVLIQGESGTGKDIIARMIHAASPWRSGPWVKVNCPAIPGTLLESELFGYEKGAFTGAYGMKPGRVEMAHRPDRAAWGVPRRQSTVGDSGPAGRPGVAVERNHERHRHRRRYQSVSYIASGCFGIGLRLRRREWDRATLQTAPCPAQCAAARLATRSCDPGRLCDAHQSLSGTDWIAHYAARRLDRGARFRGKCQSDPRGDRLGASGGGQHLGVAIDRRVRAGASAIPRRARDRWIARSCGRLAADSIGKPVWRRPTVRLYDAVGAAAAIAVPLAAASGSNQRRIRCRLQRSKEHGGLLGVTTLGGPVGAGIVLGR